MLKEKVYASRLEQLHELREVIAEVIDSKPGARDLASLVKQYRDIAKEIEELEAQKGSSEINDIIERRKANGLPGSVRSTHGRVLSDNN